MNSCSEFKNCEIEWAQRISNCILTILVGKVDFMKNINVVFEDQEFEALEKIKGKLSWHDLMMLLAKQEKER
jgi:hypothetical protein